jgi:ferredoxin
MALQYLKNVVSLSLDESKCTGCGMCINVCPHTVFRMQDHKDKIENRDACMECGACAKNCAFAALSVRTGVGCAAAVINGALRGTEPSCGCGDTSCCG